MIWFYGLKLLLIELLFRATLKAVEAAVNSRQWNKAVQILEVVEDRATCAKYYRKIAQHYATVGEYEVIIPL